MSRPYEKTDIIPILDRSLLIGILIGLGTLILYSAVNTRIFCDWCKKQGGRCEYRCVWLIFCRWVCLVPLKGLETGR